VQENLRTLADPAAAAAQIDTVTTDAAQQVAEAGSRAARAQAAQREAYAAARRPPTPPPGSSTPSYRAPKQEWPASTANSPPPAEGGARTCLCTHALSQRTIEARTIPPR